MKRGTPAHPPPELGAAAAGVREWRGGAAPLRAAAKAAGLSFRRVGLPPGADKAGALSALARDLRLPPHFGHNWDALADCLGDAEWLDGPGCVILIEGAGAFRRAHPGEWTSLSQVFGEAAQWWRTRGKPFWLFVAD